MASCTALWRTLSLPPLCTHAPINYLHDPLAYLLQVVMQISPDLCTEAFHLHLLSQVFIIFLTLCTSYHLAFYLPCYCVFLLELNLCAGEDFHLSCPVLLMLRTTCCMAVLKEQGMKEWMCAEAESWFSACRPVRILGRGLAAIILLGIFWFPVICTACDIHCVRGFL